MSSRSVAKIRIWGVFLGAQRLNQTHTHLTSSTPTFFSYLVVSVGVSEKVPEEVQTGALPDQDEVRVAVGEVGRGWEALGTAGTRAAHTGRVDSHELSVDHLPTAAVVWKTGVKNAHHDTWL